jgi:TRAP-type C4-dicarboxylate transport system permease small subunit
MDRVKISKGFQVLLSVLRLLSAVLLLGIMVLGTADVVLRYLFNSPILGTAEVIELMMGMLIFTALPIATNHRNHITIDLLDKFTPRSLARLRDIVITLVVASCLILFCWCSFDRGRQVAQFGEVTDFLGLPKAPVFYYISAFCVITAVALFFSAARSSNTDQDMGVSK